MAEAVLKIVHEGPVAWVTLNRPERLNALNRELSQALLDCFTGLRHQLATRVVILQGAGRAFCAGLDLHERQAGAAATEAGNPFETQHRIRDIMIAMRRCPQPVIGICQGAASGGGFTLALASDVRLVTPDARMNAAFIKMGLTGCDMGSSYFLPRLVGSSVASESQTPSNCPPSTASVCPVIQRACGEARNSATSAISSGVPIRPKGMLASVRA